MAIGQFVNQNGEITQGQEIIIPILKLYEAPKFECIGTGFFIGEIQLEQTVSNSKSKGTGPTDGKLLCGNDDFIEISFRMFDDTESVGKALIRNNEKSPQN